MWTSVVTIPWSFIIENSILKMFVALGFNYYMLLFMNFAAMRCACIQRAYKSLLTLAASPEVHRPNKFYFFNENCELEVSVWAFNATFDSRIGLVPHSSCKDQFLRSYWPHGENYDSFSFSVSEHLKKQKWNPNGEINSDRFKFMSEQAKVCKDLRSSSSVIDMIRIGKASSSRRAFLRKAFAFARLFDWVKFGEK